MSHKAFIKWIYSIDGCFMILLGAMELLSFCLSLGLTLTCYAVLNQSSKTAIFQSACLIGLVTVFRYTLAQLRIKCNLRLRRKLLAHVVHLFNGVSFHPEKEKIWHRFVTLDIVTLIERLPALSQSILYVLCISCLITSLFFLGAEFFWLLSIIIPYICISTCIAKKTAHVTNLIYKISQKRINKMSLWISSRSYFVNWQKDFGLLKTIDHILHKEIYLRNKDSFLRCLDFYIVIFSRSMPVIFFLILDEFGINRHVHYLAVYWFSIPIISLIMDGGRFTGEYTLAKQAATNIVNVLERRSPKKQESTTIHLNESWDIWDGSLHDNILFCSELSAYFNLLRISKEFNTVNGKDILLARNGAKISLGQKERILLLRGISLAMQTNYILCIEISFHSVDPEICTAILKTLTLLKKRLSIKIAPAILKHLESMSLRELVSSLENISTFSQKELPITDNANCQLPVLSTNLSFFRNFLELNKWHSFLFIAPAICLSLISYFCTTSNFPDLFKIFSILLLSIISILCSSKLGAFIELTIRDSGKKLAIHMLAKASLSHKDDIIHRIGKDLTVLFERLAWYVHDISWYGAIMSIGLFSVCFFSLFQGVVIILLFIGSCLALWNHTIPRIKKSQEEAVTGINQFLSSILNYNAMGSGSTVDILRDRCRTSLMSGFNRFEQSSAHIVSLKANFLSTIHFFSGSFITLTLLSLIYLDSLFLVEILLTSLLIMDHTICNLFQASSGFYINTISYQRLKRYHIAESYNPPSLAEDKKTLSIPIINGFSMEFTDFRKKLKRGCLYRLVGVSGKGKSIYLKTISGVMKEPAWEEPTHAFYHTPLYIDHHGLILLKHLGIQFEKHFFHQCIKEFRQTALLILDEVFQDTTIKYLEQKHEDLEATIRNCSFVGIVVDHRGAVGKSINIEDLIQS